MTTPTPASADIALIVRRTIRAPAARVFEAWTDPRQLQKWWGPAGVTCSLAEIEPRVGGRYRIGNRLPDGTTAWISGEFEVVEPPRRLVFTWRLGPPPASGEPVGADAPGLPGLADAPDSLAGRAERVTVRFEPRGADTEVVVVHEWIASERARVTHEQGWHGCLAGLARFAG